jgi:hypothetical protein
MLSHKNWLINVAVRASREGLLDRVAADAELTRGRRLKISHPGVGYSQAEGLTLVAEEAVEIRVLRRQARARDRSGARRVTQHGATLLRVCGELLICVENQQFATHVSVIRMLALISAVSSLRFRCRADLELELVCPPQNYCADL